MSTNNDLRVVIGAAPTPHLNGIRHTLAWYREEYEGSLASRHIDAPNTSLRHSGRIPSLAKQCTLNLTDTDSIPNSLGAKEGDCDGHQVF